MLNSPAVLMRSTIPMQIYFFTFDNEERKDIPRNYLKAVNSTLKNLSLVKGLVKRLFTN